MPLALPGLPGGSSRPSHRRIAFDLFYAISVAYLTSPADTPQISLGANATSHLSYNKREATGLCSNSRPQRKWARLGNGALCRDRDSSDPDLPCRSYPICLKKGDVICNLCQSYQGFDILILFIW